VAQPSSSSPWSANYLQLGETFAQKSNRSLNTPQKVADYLMALGLITHNQREVALLDQQRTGYSLAKVLTLRGWVRQEMIDRIVEEILQLPAAPPPVIVESSALVNNPKFPPEIPTLRSIDGSLDPLLESLDDAMEIDSLQALEEIDTLAVEFSAMLTLIEKLEGLEFLL